MNPIKVIDTKVFQDLWAILGTDEISQKHVLSLPQSSSFMGYLEYYEISKEEYEYFLTPEGYDDLGVLVKKCQERMCDERLLQPRIA